MQAVQNPLIPYANSAQRTHLQTGFPPSLSGSETDVSTSNENLTAEEKNVLKNSIRQEPQGEETLTGDIDMSSSNTLIIHNNSSLDGFFSPFYGNTSKNNIIGNPNATVQNIGPPPGVNMNRNCNFPQPNGGNSVPPSPKSRRALFPAIYGHQVCLPGQQLQLESALFHSVSPPSKASNRIVQTNDSTYSFREHSVPQEITEIPKHYLDQSEVLKHLAKEVHHHQQLPGDATLLPPPPQYPQWPPQELQSSQEKKVKCSNTHSGGIGSNRGIISSKPGDRFSISRSHPDLSSVGSQLDEYNTKQTSIRQRPKTRGRAAVQVDSEKAATHAAELIELLTSENVALKSELDMYYKKVSKLQKFEMEIQKVHQAHEELVRSSEKREKLERAIRMRLEMEIRRLQESNREVKEQLDAAMSQLSKRPLTEICDSELKKELGKRDVLIAQLLTHNKELLAEKERQEIELQAQRATLQEQRNHIDILDTALTNAQTNVVKLEDESHKKQAYVERVAQLQRALANLQLASDRRLQMERRVRMQLEREIEVLRTQKEGKAMGSAKKEREDVEQMKKSLREYEEKVIGLEAEVAKWEQKCLEESTMRQIAVDAASVPKDARIAALERTSQESEKLIAQARSEKLKQMDELYAAQRKCAELEGKMRDMESKLAERDAMIKVLQHHSQEKDAVFQTAVLGRPPRHTRAASTVGLTSSTSHTTTVSSSSTTATSSAIHHTMGSKDGRASPIIACAVSTECLNSNPANSSSTESLAASKKSLDEQLKELGSRLSSKDSIINALRAEKERYPSHFWRV